MEQVEYFIEVVGPQTNISEIVVNDNYEVSQIDITENYAGIPDASLSAFVHNGAIKWDSVYSTVSSLSSFWDSVYSYVNSTSSIEYDQEQVTAFVIANSSNIVSVDSLVNLTSAQWNSVYTFVNTTSSIEANQEAATTFVITNSANLLAVDSFVSSNSSQWFYQGTDLKSLSANWEAAYTNLVTNSSFYLTGVDLSFLSVSANWNDAYSNLVTNSAAYLTSVDLSFLSVSSNWNSVYAFVNSTSSIEYNQTSATTFVLNNSANILAVNSLVNTASSDWNTAYSNLITNSAAYLTSVDISFLSVSANWDSVYTTVQSNSSLWDYQGTDLKSLSAHWQEAYTNLVTNSAAYLTSVDLSFLSVSANWDSVYSFVNSTSSIEYNQTAATTFVLNNSANILSVDTLVNTNSANWDYQGTDLKSLSSRWDEAYTNLLTNSAAYLTSVDLSFLSVSSNWDTAYSYLVANSSIEVAQQSATTFVLNNSSNILSVDSLVNTNSSIWTTSQTQACGLITAPIVSVNSTGLLVVSSCSATLNPSTDFTQNYITYLIPPLTGYQLIANDYKYITIDYSSGYPAYNVITDNTLINHSSILQVGNVFWELIDGINESHIFQVGSYGLGLSNKIAHRLIHTERFGHESGLTITESTGRIVNVSRGVIWYDGTEISLSATNTFTNPYHFYYHSAPNTWIATTLSAYNNSQYDNNSGALQTLTGNTYAVNWVYRSVSDASTYIVLGTDSYNKQEYPSAQPPLSLPLIISKQSILVGRIIVLNGASTATQIDSAFDVVFNATGNLVHGDLAGRDVADQHPATSITNTPAGTITSTNVQDALNQLDTLKASKSLALAYAIAL